MKTRSKILVAALMASAVGVAAAPSFADSGNGMRKQPQQMAFRGHGDDDRRGGPGHHGGDWDGDGHGPRGPGGPGGPAARAVSARAPARA